MANTPFLNLVKPTDTDQALITDINNNSDKIDTGVSTLSEQIGNLAKTISSGSLHDITTSGLYYLANAVTDKPTSTGGYYSVVSNGAVVSGIYVQNSTGNSYSVTHNGSSWIYQQLAPTDHVGFAKIASVGINANSTIYLNHTGALILFSDRGGMWTEGSADRALTEIASYERITVTRETSTKLKIVSTNNYTTALIAIGNGTMSFSST